MSRFYRLLVSIAIALGAIGALLSVAAGVQPPGVWAEATLRDDAGFAPDGEGGLMRTASGRGARNRPNSPSGVLRYVAMSGNDAGNCTSSALPCRTIQYAVDQAAANDTLLVAQGTYTQTSGRPRNDLVVAGNVTQVVYINGKTLSIEGGYTTTDGFTAPFPLTRPTTIDAQQKGRGIYAAGVNNLNLYGLRITRGSAAGQGGGPANASDAGGGIFAYKGSFDLSSSSIFSNSAGAGGGIYLVSVNASSFYDNRILSNTAAITAGGLFVFTSTNTNIFGNEISANRAVTAVGAVMLQAAPSAFVEQNIMRGNSARRVGGLELLYSNGGSINSNQIISNSSSGSGGGLELDHSDAAVSGNRVLSNTASLGGGLAIFGSKVTANNNIVRGNVVSGTTGGGGMYIAASTVTLINHVIMQNRLTGAAGRGSGVFIQQSIVKMLHSTISSNTGGDNTGIAFSDLSSINNTVLTNTIIASHTIGISSSIANAVYVRGVLWSNNLTNTKGSGIFSVSGAVTGTPAFLADGYHIAVSSTAINNGIASGVAADIDGQPRIAPDLGADEYIAPPDLRVSKLAPSAVVSGTSGPTSITYTIRVSNSGVATATSIIVTDSFPAGVDWSVIEGVGPCDEPPGVIACQIPDIKPGGSYTVTIFGFVLTPPGCSALLVNQVSVGTLNEVNTANNSAQAITQFLCPPRLYLPIIRK